MYPPGPVLVYRETDDGGLQLVASGSLYSVNPDRMIIKRIRLSGLFLSPLPCRSSI
jgi:pre-rRNA-processing protein TSR1